MQISVHQYDDLPQDVKDSIDPFPSWDQPWFIVFRFPNGEVEVYNDNMEPEDATFVRDLEWISHVVQRAFEAGKKEVLSQ